MSRVFPISAEETVRFDRNIPTAVYLIAHSVSDFDFEIWQKLLELSLSLADGQVLGKCRRDRPGGSLALFATGWNRGGETACRLCEKCGRERVR
jgi:hypothetical protein